MDCSYRPLWFLKVTSNEALSDVFILLGWQTALCVKIQGEASRGLPDNWQQRIIFQITKFLQSASIGWYTQRAECLSWAEVGEAYSVDAMIWHFPWVDPLGDMFAKSSVRSWNNYYYGDNFRVKQVLWGDIWGWVELRCLINCYG